MPLEPLTARQLAGKPSSEAFLRSINIVYDAAHPERVAHFQPTAKMVPLMRALAGLEEDRAFIVVAPYGSGKSLATTYLLQLTENRRHAAPVLAEIERRLEFVSPELAAFSSARRATGGTFGLVVALHGYVESLGPAIREAILQSLKRAGQHELALEVSGLTSQTTEQAVDLLSAVKDRMRTGMGDRIVIVWDEFGRHIERLVADGRPTELIDVQLLAEFTARIKAIPVTLGLLLHQRLIHYAGSMPQSVRAEWKKIEGRFETIQYVDDSKEIYRLIGEVVEPAHPGRTVSEDAIANAALECQELGLFPDFVTSELEELLARAYPLEPVTLHLLPRLSARVAQNERTLFSFLYTVDGSAPVTPTQLFDYFSPAMQADTAVGGTYRQWLETQSAMAKVPDGELAEEALKTTCLLGLGTAGERTRSSRKLLLVALRGYNVDREPQAIIEELLGRKLLLHRKHSDEIVLWHGTDQDLRGRLEEEKRRRRESFVLLGFLERDAPIPVWYPVEYNADFGLRRYATGQYHDPESLEQYLGFEIPLRGLPVGTDAQLIHVIAETEEEIAEAARLAKTFTDSPRVIVSMPREPLPLTDAALEVECLTDLQRDADLIATDPLVAPELDQMIDDARSHLVQLVDRLLRPSGNGPRYFLHGEELAIESSRDLRSELSRLMREVFPKTPIIRSEAVNRAKPSSTIINARKKLLLNILERSGQEDLGINHNFPDASMFRSVLLHTGLYRQDPDGRWRYAMPEEIADPHLREVWTLFRSLFTEPSDEPKDVRSLFDRLREPPYGLREGLFPVFMTAALRAFPGARSLAQQGQYITDILPSDIEKLCAEPERYQLTVLDLATEIVSYLRDLYKVFSDVRTVTVSETDLIRECFDVLLIWKAQLPPAALTTKRVSQRAIRFRDAIDSTADPVQLLHRQIPRICEVDAKSLSSAPAVLYELRQELQDIVDEYRTEATRTLNRALTWRASDEDSDLRARARLWAGCFSASFAADLSDANAKGLLARLQMKYDSDIQLVESVASLLTGKVLRRWEDDSVVLFSHELSRLIREIEELALSTDTDLAARGSARHGLSELVSGRIAGLYNQLVDLVGRDAAREAVAAALRKHNDGAIE